MEGGAKGKKKQRRRQSAMDFCGGDQQPSVLGEEKPGETPQLVRPNDEWEARAASRQGSWCVLQGR